MSRMSRLLYLGLVLALTSLPAQAARPVDDDGDGYRSNVDCNDSDPLVWTLNSCGECAVEPAQGCGTVCTDNDQDSFFAEGGSCGGPVDCNDTSSSIFPGAPEVCGDSIDQAVDPMPACTGAITQPPV
jgi:hypothetical protein